MVVEVNVLVNVFDYLGKLEVQLFRRIELEIIRVFEIINHCTVEAVEKLDSDPFQFRRNASLRVPASDSRLSST